MNTSLAEKRKREKERVLWGIKEKKKRVFFFLLFFHLKILSLESIRCPLTGNLGDQNRIEEKTFDCEIK